MARIYLNHVTRTAERAAREAAPIKTAPLLSVRSTLVHEHHTEDTDYRVFRVVLRFEATGTAVVPVASSWEGIVYSRPLAVEWRATSGRVRHFVAGLGWHEVTRDRRAFLDSHGAVWIVSPPDATGAEAFGPRGAAVQLSPTLAELRLGGWVTVEDEEDGWTYVCPPTFNWPPAA